MSEISPVKKHKFNIQTFLFDMDGTLIDSLSVHTRSLAGVLHDRMGISIDQGELSRRIQGVPSQKILSWFTTDQVEELGLAWAEAEIPLKNELQLFPGMREVLAMLHASGKRLGVVTSQTRAEMTTIRRLIGIDEWIDVWVCVDDITHPKPHPEPVLLALQESNSLANQTIMIGDTMFDLRAGRQAGTLVGAALWGMGDTADLDGFHPDLLLEQPADLLQYCELDDCR